MSSYASCSANKTAELIERSVGRRFSRVVIGVCKQLRSDRPCKITM